MNQMEINKIMSESMDTIRQQSMQPFLDGNEEYLRDEELAGRAEADYMELPMSDEIREVVEAYIMSKEKLHWHYALCSYMAGMKNGVQSLYQLKLIKEPIQ